MAGELSNNDPPFPPRTLDQTNSINFSMIESISGENLPTPGANKR